MKAWKLKRKRKEEFANKLRDNPTPAEAEFWRLLTIQGWDDLFHRQVVKAGYILDFFCPALGLCIEIDGPIHRFQKRYDTRRDKVLRYCKIRTLRIQNDEVSADHLPMLEVIGKMLDGERPD